MEDSETLFQPLQYGTKYSRMDLVKFVDNRLKKNEVIWYIKQTISLPISERLSSTNFTWSILEYFVPYFPFSKVIKNQEMFCLCIWLSDQEDRGYQNF